VKEGKSRLTTLQGLVPQNTRSASSFVAHLFGLGSPSFTPPSTPFCFALGFAVDLNRSEKSLRCERTGWSTKEGRSLILRLERSTSFILPILNRESESKAAEAKRLPAPALLAAVDGGFEPWRGEEEEEDCCRLAFLKLEDRSVGGVRRKEEEERVVLLVVDSFPK